MSINISNSQSDKAITVPYPPKHREGGENFGFSDLRGNPDQAASIYEGLQSPTFRKLLVEIARGNAGVFTVGCDLGAHREEEYRQKFQFVAGGYLQLIGNNYKDITPEMFSRWANSIVSILRRKGQKNEWDFDFELAPVMLNLDGYDGFVGSVKIGFHAMALSKKVAARSREKLIAALHQAILSSSTVISLSIQLEQN